MGTMAGRWAREHQPNRVSERLESPELIGRPNRSVRRVVRAVGRSVATAAWAMARRQILTMPLTKQPSGGARRDHPTTTAEHYPGPFGQRCRTAARIA